MDLVKKILKAFKHDTDVSISKDTSIHEISSAHNIDIDKIVQIQIPENTVTFLPDDQTICGIVEMRCEIDENGIWKWFMHTANDKFLSVRKKSLHMSHPVKAYTDVSNYINDALPDEMLDQLLCFNEFNDHGLTVDTCVYDMPAFSNTTDCKTVHMLYVIPADSVIYRKDGKIYTNNAIICPVCGTKAVLDGCTTEHEHFFSRYEEIWKLMWLKAYGNDAVNKSVRLFAFTCDNNDELISPEICNVLLNKTYEYQINANTAFTEALVLVKDLSNNTIYDDENN